MVSELLPWVEPCAMGNDHGNPSGSHKATETTAGMGSHSATSLYFQLLAQDPAKECLPVNPCFLNVQLWRVHCGPSVELVFKGLAVGHTMCGEEDCRRLEGSRQKIISTEDKGLQWAGWVVAGKDGYNHQALEQTSRIEAGGQERDLGCEQGLDWGQNRNVGKQLQPLS